MHFYFIQKLPINVYTLKEESVTEASTLKVQKCNFKELIYTFKVWI